MGYPSYIVIFLVFSVIGILLPPVTNAIEKSTECYEISQNELAGFDLLTEINHRKTTSVYRGKKFANDEEYFRQTIEGKTKEMLVLKNGVTLYKGVGLESLHNIPGPFYGVAYSFMPAHAVISKLHPDDVCNHKNNGKHIVHMNEDRDNSKIIKVQTKFETSRLEYRFTVNHKKSIKGFIGFTIPEPFSDSMSLSGWSIVKDGKILKNKSLTRLGQLRTLKK